MIIVQLSKQTNGSFQRMTLHVINIISDNNQFSPTLLTVSLMSHMNMQFHLINYSRIEYHHVCELLL